MQGWTSRDASRGQQEDKSIQTEVAEQTTACASRVTTCREAAPCRKGEQRLSQPGAVRLESSATHVLQSSATFRSDPPWTCAAVCGTNPVNSRRVHSKKVANPTTQTREYMSSGNLQTTHADKFMRAASGLRRRPIASNVEAACREAALSPPVTRRSECTGER